MSMLTKAAGEGERMSETVARTSFSDRTVLAGREVLSGRRRGLRALLHLPAPP